MTQRHAVCLLVLAALTYTVAAQPTPGPQQGLDCKLRQLANDFAVQIQPNAGGNAAVSDALQLEVLCGSSRQPVAGDPARAATDAAAADAITAAADGMVFYVDPLRGDDGVGDGSVAAPHRTVGHSLTTLRSARGANAALDARAVLVLRAGTHFVAETLVPIAADRHVSIVTMPGERAVLSGGTSLGSLTWDKQADGVYMAQLPPPPPGSTQHPVFDTLYAPSGRRAIRARYPNPIRK